MGAGTVGVLAPLFVLGRWACPEIVDGLRDFLRRIEVDVMA